MRFAKTMRLNSLSRKVLLAYFVGVAFSIVLFVVAGGVALRSNVLARMDLADGTERLAARVQFDGNGRPIGFDGKRNDLTWLYDSFQHETAYRILDEAGNVALISSAGESFWPATEGPSPVARGYFDFEHDGVTILGATAPVEHGGRTWYLQLAASARLVNLIHRVALPFMVTGIVLFSGMLLVVFGLCAYITLRYTLKPLRDVSSSAAAISPRSLHARLETTAVPAEIGALVESFNRALERLERGYRVQQEFLGNAAHELKTPLALIRAQIELRDGGGKADRDSLLGDVEYMTRQVQQLLLLAEASEVHNYSFTLVRVHEIAYEVVSYLQRMAEVANVRLAVSAANGDVTWKADRGALFTLLKNLLENAIQHAPEATAVSVEIQRDVVTVRDLGPGVDVAQLPLLFTRFWRGAHRRDHGAGLGLAICQEIALAHGWRLTAEHAEPGLRFRLSQEGEGKAFP